MLNFYKDIQSLIQEKHDACKIQCEFVKFDQLDCLRNHESILLMFDDSCKEIYNDKEFVKVATT